MSDEQPSSRIDHAAARLPCSFRPGRLAKWKFSPHVEVEIVEYDRPHTWTAHVIAAGFVPTLGARPR